MSDIAIRVENLSKQYPFDKLRAGCIGGLQARYKTIRSHNSFFHPELTGRENICLRGVMT